MKYLITPPHMLPHSLRNLEVSSVVGGRAPQSSHSTTLALLAASKRTCCRGGCGLFGATVFWTTRRERKKSPRFAGCWACRPHRAAEAEAPAEAAADNDPAGLEEQTDERRCPKCGQPEALVLRSAGERLTVAELEGPRLVQLAFW